MIEENPTRSFKDRCKLFLTAMREHPAFMVRIRLLWDLAWGLVRASKVGDHLWDEAASAVKSAFLFFLVCLALIVWLYSRGNYHIAQVAKWTNKVEILADENKKLTRNYQSQRELFSDVIHSNSVVIASYQSEVQRLNNDLRETDNRLLQSSQERDKAQAAALEAQHSLAQWILLAQSHTTNTPLTEHMDKLSATLIGDVKSIGEALKEIEANRPRFEVKVNGKIVADGSIILLSTNRQIWIQARNLGNVTAEKVNLDVGLSLEKTNLVFDASRWNVGRVKISGLAGIAVLSEESEFPIPPEMTFDSTTFSIATNAPPGPVFSFIQAYSPNSKRLNLALVFIVRP